MLLSFVPYDSVHTLHIISRPMILSSTFVVFLCLADTMAEPDPAIVIAPTLTQLFSKHDFQSTPSLPSLLEVINVDNGR